MEDGRLEIDNNLTEHALRPSCIGKKNYLFFGHPEAGWRSAMIYSVIVSCRRRQIDPWDYLRDLVRRLPVARNHEIPSLVPARWKPLESALKSWPPRAASRPCNPCGLEDAYGRATSFRIICNR